MSISDAQNRPPTLVDVARAAGVSVAAASKALNGREDVSDATRHRVASAAAQLGYLGRSTNSSKSSIAFVADTFASLYTTQVLAGACVEAALQGLLLTATHLEVSEDPEHAPLTPSWLHSIARTHVGLILVTTVVSRVVQTTCAKLGIPLVAVDPRNSPKDSLVTIGATNWNASMEATEYLIGLGHRKVAYVGGPESSVPSFERFQGYLSALKSQGIPHDPALVRWADFLYPSGVEAGHSLLSLPSDRRPTAIFCASDWIALGVMNAATGLGLSIPHDVSVIGFDDTEIAMTSTPKMTAVRQPMKEFGATAVRTILDMRERSVLVSPMRLTTELVVRDSTAPAPLSD